MAFCRLPAHFHHKAGSHLHERERRLRVGESIKSISTLSMTERNGSIIPVRRNKRAFVPAAAVVVIGCRCVCEEK